MINVGHDADVSDVRRVRLQAVQLFRRNIQCVFVCHFEEDSSRSRIFDRRKWSVGNGPNQRGTTSATGRTLVEPARLVDSLGVSRFSAAPWFFCPLQRSLYAHVSVLHKTSSEARVDPKWIKFACRLAALPGNARANQLAAPARAASWSIIPSTATGVRSEPEPFFFPGSSARHTTAIQARGSQLWTSTTNFAVCSSSRAGN